MSLDRAQVLNDTTVLPEGVVVLRGGALVAAATIVRGHLRGVIARNGSVSPALYALATELEAGAQRAKRAAGHLAGSARGTAEPSSPLDVAPSPHEYSDHLTTGQAAERLDITDRQVRKLCGRTDGLPNAWQDERGTWRIPEDDVVEYAHQRQRRRHDQVG